MSCVDKAKYSQETLWQRCYDKGTRRKRGGSVSGEQQGFPRIWDGIGKIRSQSKVDCHVLGGTAEVNCAAWLASRPAHVEKQMPSLVPQPPLCSAVMTYREVFGWWDVYLPFYTSLWPINLAMRWSHIPTGPGHEIEHLISVCGISSVVLRTDRLGEIVASNTNDWWDPCLALLRESRISLFSRHASDRTLIDTLNSLSARATRNGSRGTAIGTIRL